MAFIRLTCRFVALLLCITLVISSAANVQACCSNSIEPCCASVDLISGHCCTSPLSNKASISTNCCDQSISSTSCNGYGTENECSSTCCASRSEQTPLTVDYQQTVTASSQPITSLVWNVDDRQPQFFVTSSSFRQPAHSLNVLLCRWVI
ncbi:MAG: hypothetical protein ACKVH8_17240 [Pirellulales bacterium]